MSIFHPPTETFISISTSIHERAHSCVKVISLFISFVNADLNVVFPSLGSAHPSILSCNSVRDVEVMTPALLSASRLFVHCPLCKLPLCIIYSCNPLNPLFFSAVIFKLSSRRCFPEVTCQSQPHFVFSFLISGGWLQTLIITNLFFLCCECKHIAS